VGASVEAGSAIGARIAGPWRARALMAPAVLVLAAAGTLLCDALTPRDLSFGEDAPVWNTDANVFAFDLSRALNAALLLGCASIVITSLARRGFPRAGLGLWLAFNGFVATCLVLPGFTGTVPGLEARVFYPPLAFMALYFARPMPRDEVIALCKGVLLAFVYASLAGAVIMPDHALASGYVGLVPGLDARLYGVGGGATSLGTLSSTYLAVELVAPSRSRARWLHRTAAVAALLATQAKTSWIFVVAVAALVLARHLRGRLPQLQLGAGSSAKMASVLLAVCGAVLGAAWAWSAVTSLEADSVPGGENLLTLTGRTYIWATSLRVWLDNPVFGYGLGLWDIPFRVRHGNFDHAHSQFIHSLASAGLIGLIALLVYLRALWVAAWRAKRRNAVPLVLVAGLLLMCTNNVPLRGHYLLDPFSVLHLLTFALVMQVEKEHA
jgi:O-antigen ligase